MEGVSETNTTRARQRRAHPGAPLTRSPREKEHPKRRSRPGVRATEAARPSGGGGGDYVLRAAQRRRRGMRAVRAGADEGELEGRVAPRGHEARARSAGAAGANAWPPSWRGGVRLRLLPAPRAARPRRHGGIGDRRAVHVGRRAHRLRPRLEVVSPPTVENRSQAAGPDATSEAVSAGDPHRDLERRAAWASRMSWDVEAGKLADVVAAPATRAGT